MKIKPKTSRRTKPTKNGWHSLSNDELILWVYMWLGKTGNSRFTESQRTMALRLHVPRRTLTHYLNRLVAKNVIYIDKKKAPAKDGWNFQDSYTVTNPPMSVQWLAQATWNVDADRGHPSPYGAKVVHGETPINTGDARGLLLHHISTLSKQLDSQTDIKNRPLTTDSGGGAKVVHPQSPQNQQDARGSLLHHVSKVTLKAQLAEERDELATWERRGNVKGADLCRSRIAELEAQLEGAK